ncbi:hypothetical protein KIPB_014550, partial [Kipferlia bialata]|eukprot:g14550.t1
MSSSVRALNFSVIGHEKQCVADILTALQCTNSVIEFPAADKDPAVSIALHECTIEDRDETHFGALVVYSLSSEESFASATAALGTLFGGTPPSVVLLLGLLDGERE